MKLTRFLPLILLLASGAAAAAGATAGPAGPAAGDLFVDTPDDMAHRLLSMIFGDVPGVLAGGSTLIGDLSMVLNWGLLVIMSSVVFSQVVRSIYDTAHHGEVMGKAISATWYPIRASLGVAGTLPLAKGYSLVQVAIIWACVQGSNFANIAYGVAIQEVGKGHMVTVPKNIDGTAIMYSALRSEVCAYALNKQVAASPYNSGDLIHIVSLPGNTKGGTMLEQGWKWTSAAYPNVCGKIAWPGIAPSMGAVSGAAGVLSNITGQQSAHAINTAMRGTHLTETMKLITAAHAAAPLITSGVPADIAHGREIIDAALVAYNDNIRAAATSVVTENLGIDGEGALALQSQVQEMQRDGWMSAGLWFFRIAALNDRFQEAVTEAPVTSSVRPDNELPLVLQEYLQVYLSSADGFADRRAEETGIHQQGASGHEVAGDNPVWTYLAGAISKPMQGLTEAMIANDQGMNPIVSIRNKGHLVLDSAYGLMVAMAFKDSLIEGAKSASEAIPFVGAISGAVAGAAKGVSESIPVKMFVAGIFLTLVTTGILLAYVIPMTVPMIWIMGLFTFLVICLEATIAAPVWMLGAANAEGHDVWGQTQAGFAIILALIIRPIMAVIGLFGAMLILSAIMWVVQESAAMLIEGNSVGSVYGILGTLSMLALYTYAVRALSLHSFKLIHELPDRATRYIGGGENSGDHSIVEGVTSETKGDVDKNIQNLSRPAMRGAGEKDGESASGGDNSEHDTGEATQHDVDGSGR